MPAFEPNGLVALKMRGIPFRVRVPEIEQFFTRYAFVKDSVKIGIQKDGRPNGFATLLFESE